MIWSVFIVLFDRSLTRPHTHTHKLLSAGLTAVFANVWRQWCLMPELQLKFPIKFTKLNVLTILIVFIPHSRHNTCPELFCFHFSATLFIFHSPVNFSLSNTQIFQYSKRPWLLELSFIQRVLCMRASVCVGNRLDETVQSSKLMSYIFSVASFVPTSALSFTNAISIITYCCNILWARVTSS